MEDLLCRSMWIVGVELIVTKLRLIWPPSLVGDPVTFYTLASLSLPINVNCWR